MCNDASVCVWWCLCLCVMMHLSLCDDASVSVWWYICLSVKMHLYLCDDTSFSLSWCLYLSLVMPLFLHHHCFCLFLLMYLSIWLCLWRCLFGSATLLPSSCLSLQPLIVFCLCLYVLIIYIIIDIIFKLALSLCLFIIRNDDFLILIHINIIHS